MELPAHISGQVPNEPNGNALPPQIPNLGGIQRSTIGMDPEFVRARALMQQKIYDTLLQRQPQPVPELTRREYRNFAKRLEEAMLKSALSKVDFLASVFLNTDILAYLEEYLNVETLESRLVNCIRRSSVSSHNQQYP